MRTLPAILCALFWCAQSAGQPAGVTRGLKRFDFEERNFNVEDLPVDWQKVEGRGLPFYVKGRLARDQARSGRYSFRLDLNGGSVIYRYPAGKVPVRGDAHYRVEAWVRTAGLQQSRARLTAYFTDLDGHPLTSTVRHSLYAAERDADPWKRLTLELTAPSEGAAFLVLELGLVQPSLYRVSTLGERELYTQDVRGTAWFDDVAISQVPRVTMRTNQPGNIFPAGVPATVEVLINDRFTDDLSAQLIIRDAEGRLLLQKSQQLDLAAAKTEGEGNKRLAVTLPDLRAGWYDVAVDISSQGESLGEHRLSIVRLADGGGAIPPDERFGVIGTHLPFEAWTDLPQVLPMLGTGRVKLAVWSARGDVHETAGGRFDDLIQALRQARIVPTACLIDLPPNIAAAAGGASWHRLLQCDRELWQPQLAYSVSRHASHIDRWQLGADGSDVFARDPEMRKVYDLIYAEFSTLVQSPDLAMPWPAWYDLEAHSAASVALSLPPDVLPAQVPLYVRAEENQAAGESRPAPPRISLSLQPLERSAYGRETQIRDFAQRFAYALAAGSKRIDLPLPFDGQDAADAAVGQPQELFIVLRTLLMMLGNSTFKGTVPIAENVEAFLFDRGGQGTLMLWSRGSEPGVKELAINLGQRPLRVDLWGNVTPLLAADRAAGKVRLQVGAMPVFLIGIDGDMALLRCSVKWDNDRVESSFKPHFRRLRFANPYRWPIAGQIRLRAPAGWILNPPTLAFALNPGEIFDREVQIEFPYNTFAGAKPIVAEFQLQGGERDQAFTVPIPLHLGLSDIGLQSIALRDGPDIVVQQMITNYGGRPVDYSAFAVCPGQARQERLVTGLGPGRTTIRKYRFENVKLPPGVKMRSGIKELNGTRILNDEVEVR